MSSLTPRPKGKEIKCQFGEDFVFWHEWRFEDCGEETIIFDPIKKEIQVSLNGPLYPCRTFTAIPSKAKKQYNKLINRTENTSVLCKTEKKIL
ncbi:MAG: hypothetical protein D6694_13235 [Gammaproteobacteria bacterium]|nr:MAG: hypothetical protein D6694_13235 [Gammaproteobacteria bacterium]